MANIDLKGEFLDGQPLKILTKLLDGDRQKAIGLVVEFWEMAQHYWSIDQGLIPHSVFSSMGFPKELYEQCINLAEYREKGIYARGASERFDWLLQRRRAGQAGGRKRAENLAKLKRDPSENQAPAIANTVENVANAQAPVPVPVPVPKKKEVRIGGTFPVLAELKCLEPIFQGRSISEDLQRLWLESYTAEFIIEKVRALKIWEATAGPKGKKSNWGRFYSGAFSRDWDKWSKRLPSAAKAKSTTPDYNLLDEYYKEGEKWKE